MTLSNCSDKSPLLIGRTYTFFDGPNSDLQCPECDLAWYIKVLDTHYAELSSRETESGFPSCTSEVEYKYDDVSKTFTILNISNNNVSNNCKAGFLGEWKWRDGKFGERFYSVNNSAWDFH